MAVLSTTVIGILPQDMIGEFASRLSIQDIACCERVCKEWKKVFSSDFVWARVMKNYAFKLADKSTLGCFFSLNFKPLTLKDRVEQAVKEEIKNIEKNWPKELLDILEAKKIFWIPKLELSLKDLTSFEGKYKMAFGHEQFIAPVTRVDYQTQANKIIPYLLVRIANQQTGRLYFDAIGIVSYKRRRMIDYHKAHPEHRVLSPLGIVDPKVFERLKRLIEGLPVGEWDNTVHRGIFLEATSITKDGKSVLTLF